MGIVFRRIGGRIVPILEKAGQKAVKLPEEVGIQIKNIQFMRTERLNAPKSPKGFKEKFTTQINTAYMKNRGQKIGKGISKLLAKRKK